MEAVKAFQQDAGLRRGRGLALVALGTGRFALDEDEPLIEFAGESHVIATLNGATSTDFNVMTRRERCQHRLGRRVLDGPSQFAARGDVTILFLAEGESLTVSSDAERLGLVRYDTVVFDSSAVWTLDATDAIVFVVDIFFAQPA